MLNLGEVSHRVACPHSVMGTDGAWPGWQPQACQASRQKEWKAAGAQEAQGMAGGREGLGDGGFIAGMEHGSTERRPMETGLPLLLLL